MRRTALPVMIMLLSVLACNKKEETSNAPVNGQADANANVEVKTGGEMPATTLEPSMGEPAKAGTEVKVDTTVDASLPKIPGYKDLGVVDISISPELGRCKKKLILKEVEFDCGVIDSSSDEKLIPKGPFGEIIINFILKPGKRHSIKVRVMKSEIVIGTADAQTFYFLVPEKTAPAAESEPEKA